MVDVGVRENHRIQLLRSASKLLISRPDVRHSPLKEPAVEQNSDGIRLDEMLTAGDFAGGSQKCDLHQSRPFPIVRVHFIVCQMASPPLIS